MGRRPLATRMGEAGITRCHADDERRVRDTGAPPAPADAIEAMLSRDSALARTFVQLADTLVDDFDVVELLTTLSVRCINLLDVAAAGLMLVASEGDLRVVASSSEATRIVELSELQSKEGPGLECYRAGIPLLNRPLGRASPLRWPRFEAGALEAGYRSVSALPMGLRGEVIGALSLYRSDLRSLEDREILIAQALADVATISILQYRAALNSKVVNAQLSVALDSRIVIEQAKGILAARTGVSVEAALARMRDHAGSQNLTIRDVAVGVVNGTLDIGE
jgi:hypothetical protein